MLEERARQSLSSSTISCLSLISGELLCVCVFMCWIAKYLCWSSVGEAFFTHVPAASHLRSAARERKKKKDYYLVLTMETGMGPVEPLG